MKLFQIEEPDGSPLEAAGPGAVVGLALDAGSGAVAFAVGGNAEILPGADGAHLLVESELAPLLLGLRSRAEKQLARPVTHAVVALKPNLRAGLDAASEAAGITMLEVIDLAASLEQAALAAAVRAEDVAPPISSTPG